jgi:hypothetical protein
MLPKDSGFLTPELRWADQSAPGGSQAFSWTLNGGIVGLPNLAGRNHAVSNSANDKDSCLFRKKQRRQG